MFKEIPPLTEYKHVRVLRGDQIPGGLKRPVLDKVLPLISQDTISYPADGKGSAGEALAIACATVQKQLRLLLPEGPPPDTETWHKSIAPDHVSYKVISGAQAQADLKKHNDIPKPNTYAMPIGCRTDEFCEGLQQFVDQIWQHHNIADNTEVWYAGGSGTLGECILKARPKTRLGVGSLGFSQFELDASVRFFNATTKTNSNLPFPVNPDYDALLWPKVLEKASPGAVVINYA